MANQGTIAYMEFRMLSVNTKEKSVNGVIDVVANNRSQPVANWGFINSGYKVCTNTQVPKYVQ